MSTEDKIPSETQLYVSNLPFSFGDEDLSQIFSDYRVRKAYVATRRNGRSKGFGFVDLESHEEQQAALASINEKEIEGRQLFVSVAHKDERRDDSGVIKDEFRTELTRAPRRRGRAEVPRVESDTIVYVANLPFEYEESDLRTLFDTYNPTEVRIARRRNNRSKGFGFVHFEDQKTQQMALQLDGLKLNADTDDERVISVKVSVVPDPSRVGNDVSTRDPEDDLPSETTLYVSNLPFELTDEQLGEVFSDRGVQPVRAHVARRRGNQRSKGFGFVVFADQATQLSALEAASDVVLDDRALSVKIARKGSEKAPEERARRPRKTRAPREKVPSDVLVYVSNLSFELTDEQLAEIFSEFEVKSAHVATRHTGRSKGFGFVEFTSHEDQQRALAKNGTLVMDREIAVEVANKPAEPQE